MANRRHRRKDKYFPSFEEVKQDVKSSIFEGILSRHDEGGRIREIRQDLADHLTPTFGPDAAKVFKSEREFVQNAFDAFCIFFSSDSSVHVNRVKDIDRFIDILNRIKSRLVSSTKQFYNLLDELKDAGAKWAQIGAMVTPEWKAMSQKERMDATRSLQAAHKSYRKKYPWKKRAGKKRKASPE